VLLEAEACVKEEDGEDAKEFCLEDLRLEVWWIDMI